MDAKVAAARDEQWADDLEAYRVHLAVGRKLAPGTTRMYVGAAADLLRASCLGRASELTQRHVARHLRRSPGRRTNLLRFLSWVAAESGQGFEPGRPRRTPPRKRERATLGKAAGLLALLGTAQSRRERRALLAAAIGVVHGISLSEVLVLRRGVRVGDGPSPAIDPAALRSSWRTRWRWHSTALPSGPGRWRSPVATESSRSRPRRCGTMS